jgi:acyl-CoA hydrolase
MSVNEYYAERAVTTTHLVKGEDLNHHQTLYGGRCVEWCVQAAYIAAESCFDEPRPVVFMSVRSLSMRTPAELGEIIQFTGRVDYVGESTIGIRVDARKLQPRDDQKTIVTGTFLFCTVDEHGKAAPHDLPALGQESGVGRERWKKVEESSGPHHR